jgi:precorrin-6B methylase 2
MHQLVDSATVTFTTAGDTDDSTLEISGNKFRVKDGGIVAANLATGAVTGAAGGGKLAASVITAQTELTDPLASDDKFLVHDDSASALRRVAWSSLQPDGSVLQTVAVQDSTYQSLTWTSNWGAEGANVALASTAGAQIVSGTITPSSATSKILVTVNIPAITGNLTYSILLVLFRGTQAIGATLGSVTVAINGNAAHNNNIVALDSPNSSSAVTYSVRVARVNSNAGTIYINGLPTGAAGGGAYKAVLLMQEIKA